MMRVAESYPFVWTPERIRSIDSLLRYDAVMTFDGSTIQSSTDEIVATASCERDALRACYRMGNSRMVAFSLFAVNTKMATPGGCIPDFGWEWFGGEMVPGTAGVGGQGSGSACGGVDTVG